MKLCLIRCYTVYIPRSTVCKPTISANVCVTVSAGNEEEQNMTETIAYLREFHFASVVLRLALAMLLGGCIGLERERKRRPAGFREFVTLLGPSGCGKTTTLRIIGGFEQPDSGDVFFDGKRLNDVPPYQREINTVFQRYALFPHLNVAENIAFGLHIKKLDRADIKRKTAEMLELVGLRGFENRDVTSLSGGQQQRVAIARALVCEPRVLLLDESLGALDLKLRKDMQIELKRIQQRTGITFIYVTHDQEEALTMSDRVVVMNHGVIQQVGSPTDIYNEPVNAFVADFIGESNIIDGVMLEDCKVEFCGRTFECPEETVEIHAIVYRNIFSNECN